MEGAVENPPRTDLIAGEVADNARFVQATQLNLGGSGIGSFSDRLRDAVRGGGPFDGGQDLVRRQGFELD